MALFGRFRSGISIFNKLGFLTYDSLGAHRSTLYRSLVAPANPLASRNYATASGRKEEKFKVPLAMFGGSGNYASALYIAAVKANSVQKVESEILAFVEATRNSPTFSQFIKDFSVAKDVRVKAVQEICDGAKFSDVTKDFLVIAAENGRLKNIDTIAQRFAELTMAYKGEVKAIGTTVIPLPPEKEKELKETLHEVIGAEKKVKLEQKWWNSAKRSLTCQLRLGHNRWKGPSESP